MVSDLHIEQEQLTAITALTLVITRSLDGVKHSHTELSDAGAAGSHENLHRALQ